MKSTKLRHARARRKPRRRNRNPKPPRELELKMINAWLGRNKARRMMRVPS